MGTHRSRTAVALAIVYLVWGSTYLAIRIVIEQIPPIAAMGLRFLVAGLALLAILALRKGIRTLRLTRPQLLGTALLGLLLPALGNGLVAVAEALGATSGYTALLVATVPLVVIALRMRDRDRPRPLTAIGVIVGFAGLALLVTLSQSGSVKSPWGAAAVVLLGAVFWALGTYLQPRLALHPDSIVTTAYEMLIGGIALTVSAMLFGERLTLDYTSRTWVALAYLVVFGAIVAYSAFVWLVGNTSASVASTYAYVNPLIAVLLGWQLLAEPVTWGTILGGGLVIAAVAVVILSEARRPPGGGVLRDEALGDGDQDVVGRLLADRDPGSFTGKGTDHDACLVGCGGELGGAVAQREPEEVALGLGEVPALLTEAAGHPVALRHQRTHAFHQLRLAIQRGNRGSLRDR